MKGNKHIALPRVRISVSFVWAWWDFYVAELKCAWAHFKLLMDVTRTRK